jgi:hypothetical protein
LTDRVSVSPNRDSFTYFGIPGNTYFFVYEK